AHGRSPRPAEAGRGLSRSEVILHAQHDLPRPAEHVVADPAEERTGLRQRREVERGMVQHVRAVGADLEDLVADDARALRERQIQVPAAGPPEEVAADVAELARPGDAE